MVKEEKKLAELIMFKYWPEEEWGRFIIDEKALRKRNKTYSGLGKWHDALAMDAYEKSDNLFQYQHWMAWIKNMLYRVQQLNGHSLS
ncbi:MAG: hypothetical protein IPL04_08470 [Chitinophagaceae bacterium]|nr:hypothetical protein [Chitinophagaceae bacterium]